MITKNFKLALPRESWSLPFFTMIPLIMMENQWFIDVSTTGDGKDSDTFFLNKNLY